MTAARCLLWIGLACSVGCLHEASETCANGSVCPSGLLCVDTEHTTAGGQICAATTCGNGRLDPGETCDDGNNRSGDGCPGDCTQPCGDGVLDPGEACDDGNNLDGDGCSADCTSLERSFAVEPMAIHLTALEGDPLPDPVAVAVSLEFDGDSVRIGYPPGTAQPSWLSIAEASPGDHTSELALHVTDTTVTGERSTRVRLTLGHASSTSVESIDLPVTYTVLASDLAIEAAPAALAFTAAADDVILPSRAIDLTCNGTPPTVIAAPSWLTVTAAAPSFTATINTAALAAGTALSGDIVFATSRGPLRRTVAVHAEYHVVAPPALAISATRSALTFAAFVDRALPPAQTVDVTFTGASFALISTPPAWLAVTPPAAPLTGSATFLLAVNTTALPAAIASTDLVFETTRGGQHQDVTVHVDYHVFLVPEVQYVAPYVGVAGRGGPLVIRGHGFEAGAPLTIAIGDLQIGPLTPDNDSQITVSYPALPPGSYPVTVVDPPGVAPSGPALVILASPAYAYQAIPVTAAWTRIVFDAERQILYGANLPQQQIERVAFAGGAWSAHPPKVVLQLGDVALAPDGRSLIVVSFTEIDDISLGDDLFTPIARAHLPLLSECHGFTGIAIANSGKALLFGDDQFGCAALTYDLLDHSLGGLGSTPGGRGGASGDGSVIYFGDAFALDIYDARNGTATVAPVKPAGSEFRNFSIANDASRVSLDGRIFDRSLQPLGLVVAPHAPIVSRDAARAFVYAQDWPGPRIDIYDLTAAIGDRFPLLTSIPVPDAANDAEVAETPMTTNPDDSVVFVAGTRRLLVVPVSP